MMILSQFTTVPFILYRLDSKTFASSKECDTPHSPLLSNLSAKDGFSLVLGPPCPQERMSSRLESLLIALPFNFFNISRWTCFFKGGHYQKEILVLNSFSFEEEDPRFTRLKSGLALRLLSKGLFCIRAMILPFQYWVPKLV